jgi:4-amino-4-deoxy-L-arabinose transferase-like glycosyltransferase
VTRLRQLKFWQQLSLIALAGFALRIAYILIWRREHLPLGGDALQYSIGANIFSQGKGFLSGWAAIGGHVVPTAQHPPLYIMWLAIPSWFTSGHATQLVHMLWTCPLDFASIMVIGFIGRLLGGNRCGLIAASFAAVYPSFWIQDGRLMSEPLAILLIALVIWTSYLFVQRPTVVRAIAIGGLCGLAALTRSELLLLAPLLLVPLALFRRGTPIASRLQWLVAGGLAAVIVVSPWVIYNNGRFKERVTFTTNFGATLAMANCDEVYYGRSIGFKSFDCSEAYRAKYTRPDQDESQADAELRRAVKSYIREHERRLPLVIAARWGRTLGVFRPTDDLSTEESLFVLEPFAANLSMYTFEATLLLAIAGAVLLHTRRQRLLPLVMPMFVGMISVAITFPQPRYRAPFEVALVVLAAITIDAVVERVRGSAGETLDENEAVLLDEQRDAAMAQST